MSLAIPNKSDNLIFVKSITATEASRNFSEVLDQVEAGEEIVITRGKKEIARLVPVIDDYEEKRQALIKHFETKQYFPNDPTWDIVLDLINEEDEDDPEDDAKVYGISKDHE